jgi:transglutaminase-like putative cysteine protease
LDDHEGLRQEYSALADDYHALASDALVPPYIRIDNRKVDIAFVSTDDSVHHWEVPFESLERDIERGYRERSKAPWLQASLDLALVSGETEHVLDFRPYVDPHPFEKVVGMLYAESADPDEFVHNVWHIVTQLTNYSSEIQETPRFPLETFLAGGGDCEDTAILFASMIKAAPVDWRVELVYMDSAHPTDPVESNHVIVRVDTGSASYLVETTDHAVMCPYEQVQGWYFPV